MFNKSIKYVKCEVLKIKIDDLHNTPYKCTKGRENLNIILYNQIGMYN